MLKSEILHPARRRSSSARSAAIFNLLLVRNPDLTVLFADSTVLYVPDLTVLYVPTALTETRDAL